MPHVTIAASGQRPAASGQPLHARSSRDLSFLCVYAGEVLTESPPSDPAPELLRRAQAGDEQGLEALARWCYPRVYRWALVRTGDSDEADDVTQEVVVALPRGLAGYEGRSRFTTWLYRVTANAAARGSRRHARRAALLARRPPEPAALDEESRRLAALHGSDVAALVRTLLAELPERQRTVFDLADLQGFDGPEIAEMLDLDAATIRGHLMRARRALRARILRRMPTLAEDGP